MQFTYTNKITYTNKKELLEKIDNDKNGWLLMAASDELKDDKEVVMKALEQQWTSLQYASDNLKRDKELVLFACKQSAMDNCNFHALQYLEPADYKFFTRDKEFMNELDKLSIFFTRSSKSKTI
jgi:hypothetical protein